MLAAAGAAGERLQSAPGCVAGRCDGGGPPGVLGIAGSRGCEDLEMSSRLLQERPGVRAGDGFSWEILLLLPPSPTSGAPGPICPRSLGRVGGSGPGVSPRGVTFSAPSWSRTSHQRRCHFALGRVHGWYNRGSPAGPAAWLMLEELSALCTMHLGAWLGAGAALGDEEFGASLGEEFGAGLWDEFMARVPVCRTPHPVPRVAWWEAGAPPPLITATPEVLWGAQQEKNPS